MHSNLMETAKDHLISMSPPSRHGHSHTHSSSCRHGNMSKSVSQPIPEPEPPPRLPASEMTIIQAVQYNEMDRVKELIESGKADVNEEDAEGCHILHWASINNHVELIRYLIAKGATVDIKGGNLQSTPLQWACRQGCTETFFILIDNGASMDSTDSNGAQPIHIAAQYGEIKILSYLLGSGMDVDCHDNKGYTPLIYSCIGPTSNYTLSPNTTYVCCTQLLLTFGATINYQEPNNHYTPLHFTISNENSTSFHILLRSPQINIYLRNNDNLDAYTFARFRKNSFALKLLHRKIESSKINIQPIFLQPYFTKEFVRKWLTRFFLLFSLTLIGLSANSVQYSYWIRFLFPIFTLIILYRLFNYYIFDEYTRDNFAYSYVLSSSLIMYITYWIYLQSSEWTFMHICYHLFTFYGLYCVRSIKTTNPGYLKQQTMTIDGKNLSKENICLAFGRDSRWTLEHFCITCLIRRPLRSKHCPVDKACIAKFDHHCGWLDACIGYRNHFYFIRVLTFGSLALLLWMYRAIKMFSNGTEQYTIKVCDPWFIFILIITIFNCIWVVLMTMFHLFNSIILGITVNERLTHFRYKYFCDENTGQFVNPFRNQLVKNFLETFGLHRLMNLLHYTRIDWSQVYDINQITETKIK